ncbi:MAG: acyl-homoserine-lactone synthase [Bradyrhizobium sp.]
MIFVLEGTQRRQLHYYFDRMFRLRHQIFVKEQGWNLPSVNGRYEIDEYDGDDAVYLLDITDDDIIQGSVRITPSETCSLVADYFPHLVENGASPRSPLVHEATRYIFRPLSKRAEENRAAKARLLAAMMEWCFVEQLSFLQCIVDMRVFPAWVELVPQTIPLGLPHPYAGGRTAPGGGECIAFRWPVNEEVIEGIRAYGGMTADQPSVFGVGRSRKVAQAVH